MQTKSPTLSTNMLQQILCISIFAVFCLFGHTQLPAVAAAPFEYNEEHEQYPYDLETEQSQAKYDTRLLSEQLLKEQKVSESHEWHAMHNEKDMDKNDDDENEEKTETMDYNVDDDDGYVNGDELQPHERAASCRTRGHKYTHGQKVPRLDPCEVCLCMDGEIFCWWEKCEKRKFERLPSSTTEKSRSKHKIMKKHKSAKKHEHEHEQRLTTSTTANNNQRNKNNQNADDELTKAPAVAVAAAVGEVDEKLGKSKHINQQSTKFATKKYYDEQKNKQNEHKQKQQQSNIKQQKEKQQQHSNYQHSSSSSSSKILNFPENLPSVLYYDYHTEEHEHHQHQHHEQHLKHQLLKKLQNQREHQHKQQQQQHPHPHPHQHQQKHTKQSASSQLTASPLATYPNKNGVNENAPSSAYVVDDEILTDSDILPEPPTKKPKMTPAGQTTASTAFTTTTTTINEGVTSWHAITSTSDIVGHQQSNFNNNANADNNANNFAEHEHKNENDNDHDDNGVVGVAANSPSSAILSKQQWPATVLAKIVNNAAAQHSYIGETLATSTIIARDDVVEINKKSKQKSQRPLNEKADTGKANKDLQHKENVDNEEERKNDDNENVDDDNDDNDDDAFHRWLTSTESYNKNKSDNNAGTKSYASNNKNNKDDDVNVDDEDYDDERSLTNENSDFENPFGIQNLTINSERKTKNKKNNNKSSSNSKGKHFSNKVFYPKDQQQSIQNAENGFLHNADNGDSDGDDDGVGDVGGKGTADSAADDDADYNGGGVVNIDILLTTPDELQQQQQRGSKQTSTSTKTVLQLPRAPTSIKFAADLISHANNNNSSGSSSSNFDPSAKAFNDTKMKTSEMGELSPVGIFDKAKQTAATMAIPTEQQTDINAQEAASSSSLSLAKNSPPLSVQFIKQSNMSVKDAVNRAAFNDNSSSSTVGTTTATMMSHTTTASTTEMVTTITRQCNVMGTLYNIGDVLPQDTGNCLQCICIDGSTIDDTPRVTCSPHNCPPLVLPDLFDATGY